MMEDEESRDAKDIAFGAALGELESIVVQLESGTLELEESLDRYERGVKLLKSLQARLADAQQKVTVLMGELEPESEDVEGEV